MHALEIQSVIETSAYEGPTKRRWWQSSHGFDELTGNSRDFLKYSLLKPANQAFLKTFACRQRQFIDLVRRVSFLVFFKGTDLENSDDSRNH